jgi:DNA-binding PadR family transcriptional regulator
VCEQLAALMSRGLIQATPEESTDGRIKGLIDRYSLTEAGRQCLAAEAAAAAGAAAG